MNAAELPAPQIGRILVAAGLLTEEQLAQALEEQERTGKRLGEIVVQRGFMSGPALANALAEQHGGVLKTEYGFASGLGGVAVRRAAAETGASISPLRAPAPTPLPQLRTVDPPARTASEPEPGNEVREEPNEPSTASEAPVESLEPTTVQPLLRPAVLPAPISDLEPEPEPEAHRPEEPVVPAAVQDAPVEPVAPPAPAEPVMPSAWQKPELEPVQPLLRPAELSPPPPTPELEPEPEPRPEPELPVVATPITDAPPTHEPALAFEPNALPELESEPEPPADVIPIDEAPPSHDPEPALAPEPEPSLPPELHPASTTLVPAPFVAPEPVEEAPAPEPEPEAEPEREPDPEPEPEPAPELSPAAAVPDDRDALIDSLRARVDAQEDELAVLREQLKQERGRKDVQVHVWPEEQPAPEPSEPAQPESYLLCVPTPAGYVLLDRVGALPKIGEAVEVPGENGNFTVTKVVRLPRNGRPCAYLQRA